MYIHEGHNCILIYCLLFTGLFIYTTGCVLIIENLNTGQQKHLTGKLITGIINTVVPLL
jgi:hypothetical protein